jgi:hypothetical protein
MTARQLCGCTGLKQTEVESLLRALMTVEALEVGFVEASSMSTGSGPTRRCDIDLPLEPALLRKSSSAMLVATSFALGA